MIYGIRLRNNMTGETRMLQEGARSKVNARRLGDRVRKQLRNRGARHVSVKVVRIR